MDEFVLQNIRPIKLLGIGLRGGQGDNPTGGSTDRLNPLQPHHAGTEPLMAGDPFGLRKDFELSPCGRFEAKFLGEFRVNFFEILGHIAPENAILTGIHSNYKVVGLNGAILFQQLENLAHIADADVIGIDLERFVERLLSFVDSSYAHVEHAQRRLRLGGLRHRLTSGEIAPLGEVEAKVSLELFAQ